MRPSFGIYEEEMKPGNMAARKLRGLPLEGLFCSCPYFCNKIFQCVAAVRTQLGCALLRL
jgi:hypothetical protein